MMGIFKKSKIKKCEKLLQIWIDVIIATLERNLNQNERDKIILYLLGSIDIISQQNQLNDKEFIKLATRLLIRNGFNSKDDLRNVGVYGLRRYSDDQSKFVLAGMDHIRKWYNDKNFGVTLWLSMNLNESEIKKENLSPSYKNEVRNKQSTPRLSMYMLKYICPSCGVETTTSLFKNDGFMKKSQYSIPLTEYLGGDLSKYHNQDVKCLKCHQSIKIPQKITLMKGRIAPSK